MAAARGPIDVQVAAAEAVLDHYDRLQSRAEFADVQFLVGVPGVSVPAHRAVLCQNPVFAAMFSNNFAEGTSIDGERVVPVPDASPEAFRMLLRVLYCGRIDVGAPICTLCELLALADMYQVQEAATLVAQHLGTACGSMTPDEAYRCLETAHMITRLLPGKQLILKAWPVLRHVAPEVLPDHLDFWMNLCAYLFPIYPPLSLSLAALATRQLPHNAIPSLLSERMGPQWLEKLTYREVIRTLAPLRLLPLPSLWPLAVAEGRADILHDALQARDVIAMLQLAHNLSGCAWNLPTAAAHVACAGPRLTYSDSTDSVMATNIEFVFRDSLDDASSLDWGLSPAPSPGPVVCGLFKVSLDVVQFKQELDLSGSYLGFGVVATEDRSAALRCVEPRTDRKLLAVFCKVRTWRENEGLVRNGDGKFAAVGGECLRPGDRLTLLMDLVNGGLWVVRGDDTVLTSFQLQVNDRFTVCVFGGYSGCVVDLVTLP
jgi:hypothetical protein